jgi:hypothetical protein
MLERLTRLCVGCGLLWVLVVIVIGLGAGPGTPAEGFALLDRVMAPGLRRGLYRVLGYVVVPVGMLAYLRDILRDPAPLWVKAAAPGALASVYGLFLAAAFPEVGGPILAAADPLVAGLAPGAAVAWGADTAGRSLLRFGATFLALAGVPGLLGALAGLLGGPERPRDRP